MGFFQNSVIHKYIQNLDKQTVQNAYAKFRTHFHNAAIQENIRSSKEEQYQGEFLIDLFVNVLGYTKNPTPNFNLTTEYKNVKDSKKADGAIIINEIVKAVIELKDTNTTDLNKIEVQAFGYKNNQPECEYVITSNFEKIRFYVDNAIEYLEFNLFTLTEKEFELLYICLSYDSINKRLPKQIKDESVSQEALITKKLYNDYSVFKSELYHSLVRLNPQYEPLELFKKSQKLLDRFLFIFFAEDRQLLPTNLIFRINTEWQQLREMRIEVSLYDRYKIYFNDLDKGAKVSLPAFSQTTSKQKEEFHIYAYNGGLFKKDDLLDDVKIDDDLLFIHTEKLSNYDFASEVDVNVLGHIFEKSLNELDEMKAQLDGTEFDKSKTKRKNDGVFYTPKYITKYIIDNTVGRLCVEKKESLQILEHEYLIDKKRLKKPTQDLTEKLNQYRHWLFQLTICDPACGSGAFLNQALDFLISEHRYIDELQAKLFGDALVLSDVEGSILESNLFGVDINEESVDIAKLSLWLRTAQPNRKLNDLNCNIKCGNSIIDDVLVAGDKAFNWKNEFPKIFDKGGFDIIIGNPPYGAKIDKSQINFISKKFSDLITGEVDTYVVFYFESISLLRQNGYLGFITPDTWLTISKANGLRKFIHTNSQIIDVFDKYKPFQDAKDTRCHTVVLKKNICNDYNFDVKVVDARNNIIKSYTTASSILNDSNSWNLYSSPIENSIFKKMEASGIFFENCYNLKYGLRTGDNNKFLTKNVNESERRIKIARGSNIVRYYFNWQPEYLINSQGLPDSYFENSVLNSPKIIVQYVRTNSTDLKSRWLEASYIEENNFVPLNSTSFFYLKDKNYSLKFLLAIVSSNILNYYYKAHYTDVNVKPLYLSKLPLPKFSESMQINLDSKVDEILSLNIQFQGVLNKFCGNLLRKFNLESLSHKLEDWYLLSYSDFIKELAKKKIKLSLSHEAEWEEYFNTESKKALELKSKIDATDKEIDQMVYKLYDLTEDEIRIIEGNN